MLDKIEKSEFLKYLYPSGISFESVEVVSIVFIDRGPSVVVAFTTDQIPKVAPQKWPSEFNRVRIELEFFDLEAVRFTKWGRINTANISFNKKNEVWNVAILGNEIDFVANTKWIYFKSISPYLSE